VWVFSKQPKKCFAATQEKAGSHGKSEPGKKTWGEALTKPVAGARTLAICMAWGGRGDVQKLGAKKLGGKTQLNGSFPTGKEDCRTGEGGDKRKSGGMN